MANNKIKKLIHLEPLTTTLCAELSSNEKVHWSKSINSLAKRYKLMIDTAMPSLTVGEWNVLDAIYSDRVQSDDVLDESTMIEWLFRRALTSNSKVKAIVDLHKMDANEFISKIASWTVNESIAVLHEFSAVGTNMELIE